LITLIILWKGPLHPSSVQYILLGAIFSETLKITCPQMLKCVFQVFRI
jgi:hypothetical protein